MEAISVPVYIIPIRSRNLCNRDVRKGRERKRNLSFVEGSRIPLSRRMTYQPACPRLLFFFFSILFSTFERKIDGLITRFTFGEYRGGEGREDVSAREATGSTCSLPLRHCYSTKVAQKYSFSTLRHGFTSLARIWIRSSSTDPVNLSRGEMPRSCFDLEELWMADLATIEGTPLNVKECWEIGDSLERLFVFRIRDSRKKLEDLNWKYRKRSLIISTLPLNKYRSNLRFSTRIDWEFRFYSSSRVTRWLIIDSHPRRKMSKVCVSLWLELIIETEGSVVGLPSFDFQETRNWRE